MLKVAVIGGGSTYTPELVNGFLDRLSTFPLTDLTLMDNNPERLAVVGGFAQRMVAARGNPFAVHLTTDQAQAVEGASYVTTQLRVGMMPARRGDEYLGLRHGLIGQETTGIGGMAKALRTIPVILGIAADMRAHAAPGALLVNFTNPSGLVTEALFRYAPDVPAVGVCNSAIGVKMSILRDLAEELGTDTIDPARAEIKTLGLNHLTWYHGFTLDGEDLWRHVMTRMVERLRADPTPEWDPDLIETLGLLPYGYLQYYYSTAHKLAAQTAWPPSRAEQVQAIEEQLLRDYADPERVEPPPGLMQRGGAYYSTVATQLLNAHYNDLGETHVANVRQAGAVRGWNPDWVMELPCRVDAAGVHPLPIEPLGAVAYGLIAQVKSYEMLTAQAAVTADRRAAYEALLAHPLGPQADQITAVLEDMLAVNRPWLPAAWYA